MGAQGCPLLGGAGPVQRGGGGYCHQRSCIRVWGAVRGCGTTVGRQQLLGPWELTLTHGQNTCQRKIEIRHFTDVVQWQRIILLSALLIAAGRHMSAVKYARSRYFGSGEGQAHWDSYSRRDCSDHRIGTWMPGACCAVPLAWTGWSPCTAATQTSRVSKVLLTMSWPPYFGCTI